jgi:hypothetical protein
MQFHFVTSFPFSYKSQTMLAPARYGPGCFVLIEDETRMEVCCVACGVSV